MYNLQEIICLDTYIHFIVVYIL